MLPEDGTVSSTDFKIKFIAIGKKLTNKLLPLLKKKTPNLKVQKKYLF